MGSRLYSWPLIRLLPGLPHGGYFGCSLPRGAWSYLRPRSNCRLGDPSGAGGLRNQPLLLLRQKLLESCVAALCFPPSATVARHPVVLIKRGKRSRLARKDTNVKMRDENGGYRQPEWRIRNGTRPDASVHLRTLIIVGLRER